MGYRSDSIAISRDMGPLSLVHPHPHPPPPGTSPSLPLFLKSDRSKIVPPSVPPPEALYEPFRKFAISGVLRFRVCFGALNDRENLKSARKRNTPENADSQNGQFPAFSGVLRFRVLFVLL